MTGILVGMDERADTVLDQPRKRLTPTEAIPAVAPATEPDLPLPAPPAAEGRSGASSLSTTIARSPMEAMQSPLTASKNMGMGSSAPGTQQAMLGGSSILNMANTIAAQLSQLDAAQQHLALKQLRAENPSLADLVLQFLQSMPGGGGAPGTAPAPGLGLGATGEAAQKVDMRPMPEKLPPRRAAGIV